MTTIRVLFLGASRLVGLMERFRAAATSLGVAIDLESIEDGLPWHAIAAAGVCRVVRGPAFAAKDFDRFLVDRVVSERFDVVIPAMDGGLSAVARLRDDLRRAGALPIVSRPELVEAMHDKGRAEEFFRVRDLPIPGGDGWPRLAKPRFGASSRGHVLFRDPEELAFWAARNRREEFIIQPFLTGTEYSVDAYVGPDGRLLGAVARVREVISGGEVMVTRTEKEGSVLEIAEKVAALPGWHGPLNIQVMRTAQGAFLLEVNPRFSSGVTCAIEAGLDGPRYVLCERLGQPLPERRLEWRSGLCMTRSRKDHFLWLS